MACCILTTICLVLWYRRRRHQTQVRVGVSLQSDTPNPEATTSTSKTEKQKRSRVHPYSRTTNPQDVDSKYGSFYDTNSGQSGKAPRSHMKYGAMRTPTKPPALLQRRKAQVVPRRTPKQRLGPQSRRPNESKAAPASGIKRAGMEPRARRPSGGPVASPPAQNMYGKSFRIKTIVKGPRPQSRRPNESKVASHGPVERPHSRESIEGPVASLSAINNHGESFRINRIVKGTQPHKPSESSVVSVSAQEKREKIFVSDQAVKGRPTRRRKNSGVASPSATILPQKVSIGPSGGTTPRRRRRRSRLAPRVTSIDQIGSSPVIQRTKVGPQKAKQRRRRSSKRAVGKTGRSRRRSPSIPVSSFRDTSTGPGLTKLRRVSIADRKRPFSPMANEVHALIQKAVVGPLRSPRQRDRPNSALPSSASQEVQVLLQKTTVGPSRTPRNGRSANPAFVQKTMVGPRRAPSLDRANSPRLSPSASQEVLALIQKSAAGSRRTRSRRKRRSQRKTKRTPNPELMSASTSYREANQLIEKAVDGLGLDQTPRQQTSTTVPKATVGQPDKQSPPSMFHEVHKLMRKAIVGPRRSSRRHKGSNSEVLQKTAAEPRETSRQHRRSNSELPTSTSREVQALIRKALIEPRRKLRSKSSTKRPSSASRKQRVSADHKSHKKPNT